MRKIITTLAAYTVIAFLTFGWSYNHTELCFHGPHPTNGKVGDWCYTEAGRVDRAAAIGAFWPIWAIVFTGRGVWTAITQGAIAVTKWP